MPPGVLHEQTHSAKAPMAHPLGAMRKHGATLSTQQHNSATNKLEMERSSLSGLGSTCSTTQRPARQGKTTSKGTNI